MIGKDGMGTLVLMMMAAGAGAATGQSASTGPAFAQPGTEPAYANTRQVPEELLEGPRRQVIILPREPAEAREEGGLPGEVGDRSGGVVARVTPEAHRLPEGYVIGSRSATIERQAGGLIARLVHQEGMPDAPPLRLLPNRVLATLEAILAEVTEAGQFLLTGRITEFQGANYLLVEHVSQVLAPPAPPPEPSVRTASAPGAVAAEPTAEEIVQQLMKSEPERALVLPSRPAAAAVSAPAGAADTARAPGAPESGGFAEGTFVVEELGRIVPGGEGVWSLAFEDRGALTRRKPIRLLPNRLLETALALSGGEVRGVVFLVSGEVTTHKGTNYLLLRKVLVRRDLGNFR